MIVKPQPKKITPPGPLNKPKGPGMVSSHGPGSGAPPTAPTDPVMQRGYDSYARKLAKLGANGDPEQIRLAQQGMAHYRRRGAVGGPAPMPLPGISSHGPGSGAPPTAPIGGGYGGPLPPGVGPGPIVPLPEDPLGGVFRGNPTGGFDPNGSPVPGQTPPEVDTRKILQRPSLLALKGLV